MTCVICGTNHRDLQDHPYVASHVENDLARDGVLWRKFSHDLREAAQAVVDWEDEYRKINNLGKAPDCFVRLDIKLAQISKLLDEIRNRAA